MTDKRYPTRMHEVLGVEPEEQFQFEGRTWTVDAHGIASIVQNPNFYETVGPSVVCRMVNHPERITRRPRLTEEQVEQLKALVTLGFKWLCQGSNDYYVVYVNKPVKSEYGWDRGGHFVILGFGLPADVITDLVSWSDPEPLDIVQTLRDAGVEVEG